MVPRAADDPVGYDSLVQRTREMGAVRAIGLQLTFTSPDEDGVAADLACQNAPERDRLELRSTGLNRGEPRPPHGSRDRDPRRASPN